MSRAWAGGSTTAWRKLRAAVLDRDGHLCRLQLAGCTRRATCVHHTLGRAVTGDDPTHLIAACEPCNAKIGDPRAGDPRPTPRTRW